MSKYCLVASYYDMYEKNPSLKYKGEVEINLPGVDLAGLHSIDMFTASHTRTEIFNILEKELGITGRNQLSIKYQKNKDSLPTYYKVIENSPEFVLDVKEKKVDSYWLVNKQVRGDFISEHSLTFLKEWKNLLEIIEACNIEKFEQIYPYKNNNLTYLVKRYIGSSYDTNEEQLLDLQLIKKEFSRYKTFRGWIVNKDKKVILTKSSSYKNNSVSKVRKSNLKEFPKQTIEEIESNYEKEFNDKNKESGVTYQAYQAHQYNVAYLDDDKEEFLEKEELGVEDDIYYPRRKR